jgi:hypothetical protein
VVSFTPRLLYPPGKELLVTHWIGGWVSLRAVLDAVMKRKIPSLRRGIIYNNVLLEGILKQDAAHRKIMEWKI